MTPVLAAQFAAFVAWFGLAALAIGLFQFLCWMRYGDEPSPPTGCPLPDDILLEQAAENDAWSDDQPQPVIDTPQWEPAIRIDWSSGIPRQRVMS